MVRAAALVSPALGLLALQPNRLTHRPVVERDGIVISAVKEGDEVIVLSRYGDSEWLLWPFFLQSNVQPSQKILRWGAIPSGFREAVKAAVYEYWKNGLPGGRPPEASTLVQLLAEIGQFLAYLTGLGVKTFAQVKPLHFGGYVSLYRDTKKADPQYMVCLFNAVELLWTFGSCDPSGLRVKPWPKSSACEQSGYSGGAREASVRTEVIPEEVLKAVHDCSWAICERAPEVLEARDAGRIIYANLSALVVRIRDAIFFLLGLATGARPQELISAEIDCLFKRVIGGVEYTFLRLYDHKTGQGEVEYLVPQKVIPLVSLLIRWSAPMRARLEKELSRLRERPPDEGANDRLQRLMRLHEVEANLRRLFLGEGTIDGPRAISFQAAYAGLKRLGAEGGVDWKFSARQMRRTFAYTIARQGQRTIRFLKWQLHHSSYRRVGMYAAAPQLDPALVEDVEDKRRPNLDPTLLEDIEDERREHKVARFDSWLDDKVPLSGGAGRRCVEIRARVFENRQALIEETADEVDIRSTGHSWCLTNAAGCGGEGLYEATLCGDCSDGVIDEEFAPVWQELYLDQESLSRDASAWGEGARHRTERSLKRCTKVLRDLNIPLP